MIWIRFMRLLKTLFAMRAIHTSLKKMMDIIVSAKSGDYSYA